MSSDTTDIEQQQQIEPDEDDADRHAARYALGNWAAEHHPPRTLREHLAAAGVDPTDEWVIAELEARNDVEPEYLDLTFPLAMCGWDSPADGQDEVSDR